MIKFNKEKLKNEYKQNLKGEKKRYNTTFFLAIVIIWLIYSIFGNIFEYALSYNIVFVIITVIFILIWDKKHPMD